MMLEATDTRHAPWFIVRSDDKRRARLNCIAHLLKSIPYKAIRSTPVKLPKRSSKGKYDDHAPLHTRRFASRPTDEPHAAARPADEAPKQQGCWRGLRHALRQREGARCSFNSQVGLHWYYFTNRGPVQALVGGAT